MTQTKLNRDWVKTAAIIFLSILLILTFFSNTILNKSLPEVSTAAVESGSITAKVKGTGTVSAIGNTKITAEHTYTVASVKVKEGTEVVAGDALIVMGAASEELETAENDLSTSKYGLMRAQNSYPADSSAATIEYYERMVADAEYRLEIAQAKIDPEMNDQLKEIKNQISAIQTSEEYIQLQSQVSTAQAALTNAQTNFEQAEELLDLATEAKYADPGNQYKIDQYTEAEENYNKKKTDLDTAQANFDAVNTPYQVLVAKIAGLQAQYDSILSSANTEIASIQSELTKYKDKLNSEMESAAASSASNAKAAQSAYIDVLEYSEKVEKAEDKVAKLQGGEDNAVTAPVAGTVSSISVSPGDKVTKGDVMMLIEVPDLGYTMSYSVTNDQAKRIKVGDTATVSNYYWGSDITATVSSIKVDPKNPKTNKLITFTLEGDLNSGSELTVSVGEKSANYDIIVPNSAVRNDSNGNFVLIINAKNNALGNRYFAKRVSVEVLASDDNNSAVSGELSNGDFVITTSSEPIKNGDQVRMSDNG